MVYVFLHLNRGNRNPPLTLKLTGRGGRPGKRKGRLDDDSVEQDLDEEETNAVEDSEGFTPKIRKVNLKSKEMAEDFDSDNSPLKKKNSSSSISKTILLQQQILRGAVEGQPEALEESDEEADPYSSTFL